MITGHVFIAASLDGFIAREDNGLDWLMKYNTTDEDHGFAAFMDTVDGLVMGSSTFRTVLGFGGEWPYDKPVVVLSQSMTADDIPDALKDRVTLSTQQPAALFAALSQQGWTRAYVDGGAVIRSFLKAGLIADLAITTVPVLIGRGRKLFGDIDLDADIELTLQSIDRFNSGLVLTRYCVSPTLPRKDAK